ncbi:MAG: FkbM family methyltransferase [Pseudomonadota bacterium]
MKNWLRIGLKALRLGRVTRYRRALLHGVAAALEHTAVLRALSTRRLGLVIDIGANVGQFTLAVRHCLPDAMVLAFEPLPLAARRFRQVHGADPQVELVEAAVGPVHATCSMHVSKSADSSSLLPIGRRQRHHFPGTEASHQEQVRVLPLEAAVSAERLGQGTLLKIDVQGFELSALQGCESLLGWVDVIYVECSFLEFYDGQALADEVIAWLHQRGFGLSGIGPLSTSTDGVAVQADLLFERKQGRVTGV